MPGAADMWDLTISGVHDFYITSGDSSILVHNNSCSVQLGKNLEQSGVSRQAETDAHHIVASSSPKAVEGRAVMENYGVDINSEENGVFRPSNLRSANPLGATVHSTLHTNEYYEMVNQALSGASSYEDVVGTISTIRGLLLGGVG